MGFVDIKVDVGGVRVCIQCYLQVFNVIVEDGCVQGLVIGLVFDVCFIVLGCFVVIILEVVEDCFVFWCIQGGVQWIVDVVEMEVLGCLGVEGEGVVEVMVEDEVGVEVI